MLNPALLPVLLLSVLPSAIAQVPRACVANVTQPNSTCCPSIPGDATGALCGGPSRGSCVAVRISINGSLQAPTTPLPNVYDTRMDWPVHLFEYMCHCSFFYSGLACEHSKLSFGPGKGNPFKKFFQRNGSDKRIRRNIANLTSAERLHVREVLVQSKKQMSDWVIINDTAAGVNPDGTRKISYFNVSVYDYFVFLNFYATRGVNFNSSALPPASPLPDLAHKSPNFVPFNRWYLSSFEAALDGISRNLTLAKDPNATAIPPFALPYWNWTDQTECEACTDDLMGAMDGEEGGLAPVSPFASWKVLCQNEEPTWHPCDPNGQRPLLWRSYGDDVRHESLPTAAEVNFTLTAPNYDVEPFNETSNSSSFRNLLEGYIGADNNFTAAEAGQRYMGMKVRNFINGTWSDLALGPNDPLFFLHQAFIDKIYEDWKAGSGPSGTDMPADYVARPGEDRSENLAPFLPPKLTAFIMFGMSMFSNGYSYDTPAATGIAKQGVAHNPSETASAISSAAFLIIFAAVAVVVAVGSFLFQRRRRAFREVQMLTFEPVTERHPLLPRADRSSRV